MKTIKNFFPAVFFLITFFAFSGKLFSQQSNNNAFVFNGENSVVYVKDGQPVNTNAKQNAFQYFNRVNSTNNNITVQAWIYLLGDNPGVTMPIIYRSVEGGTSFSMYVKNNKAYFSVGNSQPVSTSEFPAFSWIHITGMYDGQNLRIYNGNVLSQSVPVSLNNPYSAGKGLYIGKSEEGAFKGLIDEIRIWKIALTDNNINGSGGNGNPAEPFPSVLRPNLAGQYSFTGITNNLFLADLSDSLNNLRVENINQIVPSKNIPFLVVNSTSDLPDLLPGDGKSDAGNGIVSLRAAIEEANALSGKQIIYFYIPGNGPHVIQPASALPYVTDSVELDATSQRNYTGSPLILLDGSQNIETGLSFFSNGNTVRGLSIKNFIADGISLGNPASGGIQSNNNLIENNIISYNGAAGVAVKNGINNRILSNSIFANEGIGIDLWSLDGNGNLTGGINQNDPLDADEGNNNLQNYPVLTDFYSGSTGTSIAGYLESTPNKTFKLQFFSSSPNPNQLDPREGEIFLGEKTYTTDLNGIVEFQANLVNASVNIADGHSVSATATDEDGNTSEFSMAITTEFDDGDHYLFNTTLGGIPLHWKEGKSKYSIAPSVVALGYDSHIDQAFNTYSALEQLTFTRRFLPPDSTNEN